MPSLLPNCPAYLSGQSKFRESPDERKERIDNKLLQESLSASVSSKEQYDKRKNFSTFSELLNCLNLEKVPAIWTVIHQHQKVLILFIDSTSVPVIKASVLINEKLEFCAYFGNFKIHKIGKYFFP